MKRVDVLNEINILMDQKCNGCKTHAELVEKHGDSYTKIDTHCNRQCDVGKQLQELGKQLTN